MQRKNIILMITPNSEPVVRGNLKKLCLEFGLPYHTLCRLDFPIIHKDIVIYRVEFK